MAAYYPAPPAHYPYYEAPPPPPGATHTPAVVMPQPLPQQPYLASHPQFVAYAPQIYPRSSHDEVRTLFIAGLPEDVKAREIYNLFREFPGYESSHLRTNASTQPFAFAVFVDQQSAVMALHSLNGMVFDLEKGSTLYIDLAKSNPRSKRLRADDEGAGSEKRMKSSTYSRETDSGGSIHMPGIGNSAHNTNEFPSTQRSSALLEHVFLLPGKSMLLVDPHINLITLHIL
ncbi:OLC1v1010193C3 [Oldenlandia corymbosa var. corymbosa]|uniref:OLC1v1010193C3 n=1 Tax=Oldenlandia corymbosa var. corymbosa TaxID=529605 RepID=A0AAV1DU26_OLDCO|nr:OLC1v1010193C3 [Oldenlandia corymbosa var. corymbosa]